MASCDSCDAKNGERKECPNVKINEQNCSCASATCERHGICCECVAYHKDKDQLPACLRHLGPS